MPTVRCPICGAVNPNGRRRLARCRICREKLGRCRYCHHYDPRLLDCTSPSHRTDQRILDADEALNCPEFSSTLTSRQPAGISGLALLRTAAIAGALGILAAFAFVRLYRAPTQAPPPVTLRTSVNVPEVSFSDSGFDVRVLVRNQADCTAQEVKITIVGPSTRHLTCQYIRPAGAYIEGPARSACALIGDLEPGEIGSVLFHFRAARTGELRLAAHVTAANLEAVEKVPIEGEVVP